MNWRYSVPVSLEDASNIPQLTVDWELECPQQNAATWVGQSKLGADESLDTSGFLTGAEYKWKMRQLMY